MTRFHIADSCFIHFPQVRLQTQAEAGALKYKGTLHCFTRIIREEKVWIALSTGAPPPTNAHLPRKW
jgi:hypothetical protein